LSYGLSYDCTIFGMTFLWRISHITSR